jgi:hypothetical protein
VARPFCAASQQATETGVRHTCSRGHYVAQPDLSGSRSDELSSLNYLHLVRSHRELATGQSERPEVQQPGSEMGQGATGAVENMMFSRGPVMQQRAGGAAENHRCNSGPYVNERARDAAESAEED